MNVFVTGGTGFVGSHVVEKLLANGDEPICLVRETSDTTHLDNLDVDQIVGELKAPQSFRQVVGEVDAVLHIAGLVKARNLDTLYRVNADATQQLAELTAEVNPELNRFVYVSTLSARGPSKRPKPEQTKPVSHYGKSKRRGEEGVMAFKNEIDVTIFRPPIVYGPRDTEVFPFFQAVSHGFAPLYGDGSNQVSLIYVEDLANVIVKSLETPHPSGTVLSVEDGNPRSQRQLISGIADIVGTSPYTVPIPRSVFAGAAYVSGWFGRLMNRAVMLTPDKLEEIKRSWVCDSRHACESLGWESEWSFAKGGNKTWQWYRKQGWL